MNEWNLTCQEVEMKSVSVQLLCVLISGFSDHRHPPVKID